MRLHFVLPPCGMLVWSDCDVLVTKWTARWVKQIPSPSFGFAGEGVSSAVVAFGISLHRGLIPRGSGLHLFLAMGCGAA